MSETKPGGDTADEARARIEDARAEAAAYVVQRQPLDPGDEVGEAEERIVEAVDEARGEADAEDLEVLAGEAEAARDDIRRELYGRGSVPDEERP